MANKKDKEGFWAVSVANCSNEDYGPTYIALWIDDALVELVRSLRNSLRLLTVSESGFGRTTWFGARVLVFDDPDENETLVSAVSSLADTEGAEAVVALPRGFELLEALEADKGCGDWREELCGVTVYAPSERDRGSVYANCLIKHTDISVESMESFDGYFPADPEDVVHRFTVDVSKCTVHQASSLMRQLLDSKVDVEFEYRIGWSSHE